MASDKEGVRITFDDSDYAGAWPAYLASPEAGVDMLLSNYGKTVTNDEGYFRRYPQYADLAYNTRGYLTSPDVPFDAIPRSEYENLLGLFQDAYMYGGADAETVKRMLDESARVKRSRMKK